MSVSGLGGLSIAAGDILLKKYRVEKLIGEGGTGIVLSATHVQLEQRVAIKFLRRALDSNELRTRFEREARAMGKIESDHVVLVLDAGALDDGAPYMVMEYLDGRDLARVLKEDGPLPVEQAVDCMLQVCEALEQAHDNGIVHRDLKPANLFLTRQPDHHVHIKVVDFGISKILDKKLLESANGVKAQEVTSAFTMLGSPRYMAPEQVRNSKEVDGRTDLWSVGAVLFQLITGKHAFDAEGNVQASVAVLTADPQSLKELAPHGVPDGLEEVVNKCLTRDVTQRFQTATELAKALRPYASARANESLDRIHSAVDGPSLKIALSVASTSTPPPARNPAVLPTGARDVTTERKIRIETDPRDPRRMVLDPSLIPVPTGSSQRLSASSSSSSSSSPPSKVLLAAIGVGAFVVIFGAFVAIKRLTGSSGTSTSSAVIMTSQAPGSVVPLDAGKASP